MSVEWLCGIFATLFLALGAVLGVAKLWHKSKRRRRVDGTMKDWPKFSREERYYSIGIRTGDSGSKLLFRRDFLVRWNEVNPILNEREIGVVVNTGEFKIGDGVKRWKDLRYYGNLFKARNE